MFLRVASYLERMLVALSEGMAALLLVAVIVILSLGVISRYVFDAPLIWSEEMALLLFRWLAMIGATIALHRQEHMRMTAFVSVASPLCRRFLEVLATEAALVFLLLIGQASVDFAEEAIAVTNPALGISNVWRAAALPVGMALMILMALLWLIKRGDWVLSLLSLAVVLTICVALFELQPVLRGLGHLNLVIFFVGGVAVCVFSGIPIAFSFGLATFGYIALTTNMPLVVIVSRMDEGMSHLVLLSVPLFVLLGLLTEMTGMARAMVAFLANLVGHVRGGLFYVLVGAMYLVSGISGSKAADQAALAPVLFPEMLARGAKPGELVALLAATGAQTETIPPSLVLITLGSVTSVSIGALFRGGLLPGAVVGLMLCCVVWWRNRGEDLSGIFRPEGRVIFRSFLTALPALALPFLIRYGVVEGVATATEVSTIGIGYAVLVGLFFYRRFDWAALWPMLIKTVALSGAILLIIGAATGMGWSLTVSGISNILATSVASLPGGKMVFIIVSILVFVVLGSVLEGIPAIVLLGPLMFPLAARVGVNEIHYAMIVILAMGMGLFAPPFGVGYYTTCAISRIDPAEGLRPIMVYMLALLVGVIIVASVPWISVALL
jgi:tripartite ATP-independent transporter DctM subunit